MEQVPAVKLLSNGVEVDGKVIDDYGLFSLKLTPDTPINIISEVSLNGVVLPVGTVTDLLAEGMYLRDVVRQCALYSKCDDSKSYKATFSIVSCHHSDGLPEVEVIEYDIPLETKTVQACKKDGNLLFSRYPLGASEIGALVDEGVVTMPNDLPRFKYRLTKTTNIIGLGVQVYDDSETFDPNQDWELAIPPEKQDFGMEFFYLEGNTEKLFVEVSSNAPFEVALYEGTVKAVNAPSRRLSPHAAYSIIIPAFEAGINTDYKREPHSSGSAIKYAQGSITVVNAVGKAIRLSSDNQIHVRSPNFTTAIVSSPYGTEGEPAAPYVHVASDIPFALATGEGYVQAKQGKSGSYSYVAAASIDVLPIERRQMAGSETFAGTVAVLVLGTVTMLLSVSSSGTKIIAEATANPTSTPANSQRVSQNGDVVVHKVFVDPKGFILDLGSVEGNSLATGNSFYLKQRVNGVFSKSIRVVRRARMGTVWGYCDTRVKEGRYSVVIDGTDGRYNGETRVVEVSVSNLSQFPNPSIFFEDPQVSVFATQVEGVNVMFNGNNTIYIRSDAPVRYEVEGSNEVMSGSNVGDVGMNVTKVEFNTKGVKNVKLRILSGEHTNPDDNEGGVTLQTHTWSVVDAEKETAIITDVPTIATLFGKQFPVLLGKAQVPVKNAAEEAGLTVSPASMESLHTIVSVNAVHIEKDDEIEPAQYTLKVAQGAGTDINGSYNVVSTCAEAGVLSEEPLPDVIVRSSSQWDKSIEAGQGVTVHHVFHDSIVKDGYKAFKVDVRENTAVTKEWIEEQVTHKEQNGIHVFSLPDGCIPTKVSDWAAIIEGRVYSEKNTCACVTLCQGKLVTVHLTTTSLEV
jgi:hypothetical protein